MTMSIFQKVTLVSCMFLCVSVLLPRLLAPRGRREVARSDGGPIMQQQPERQAKWGAGQLYANQHRAEAIAKGGGVGTGGGSRSNLMGQILPVYGFGLFLYILYIVFKITSQGKNTRPDNRFSALTSETFKRKITDYELAQLQEKLKETEEVMERIVSKAGHHSKRERRARRAVQEQEERLLWQLKEIARVMREGRLVEGLSPEMEAEHMHYAEDWEGYSEETYPQYEEPCSKRSCGTIILEEPDTQQPTAEEQAEKMQMESREEEEKEEELDQDSEEEEEELWERPCTPEGLQPNTATEEEEQKPREKEANVCKAVKQITFSDKNEVFLYPEESSGDSDDTEEAGSTKGMDEDDDPVAMAESLSLSSEAYSNEEKQQEVEEEEDTEEQTEPEDSDELLDTGDSEEESCAELEIAEELGFGALRKRNRREPQ
ncbi:protein RIC-3-like isoform X1 [Arapaima gigas]